MAQVKRGVFITFEGTDGSGKSTLIRHLTKELKKLGQSIITTREPGGSPLSEKIRTLIIKHQMDPWTEMFLYEASRSEHVKQKILPALKAGQVVLCDRFTDSSLAYQAHTRGLPWKEVTRLNELATHGVRPHLKIFLDTNPKRGLGRAKAANRFEAEGIQFQMKARRGFLKAMAAGRNWLHLKTLEHTPGELTERVIQEMRKRRLIHG